MNLFLLLIFSLGLACTTATSGPEAVSGYDRSHQFRSATLLPEGTMCTEIFTEGDQYSIDCRKAGFESHRIECHEYLCSGDIGLMKK